MATLPRVSDTPEVQSHYALQGGVTAALVAALRKLWALVDPKDPAGSSVAYTTAVAAVVNQYALGSASFGADYYDAMRVRAGVTDPFRVPMVDPPPVGQVQASLDWATRELTRPTLAPDPLATSVQAKVEAVSQKLVTDTGRNEVIAAFQADAKARGWARVARADGCYFCRAMATRGAVYKNEMTAGKAANARFEGDGEAKFHNNCHCVLEPVFGQHYEMTAQARADLALWNKVTKGKGDKLNAFRRAVERP